MIYRLLRRPVLHGRAPTSPTFIQYRSLRPAPAPVETLNPTALTEFNFQNPSGKGTFVSAGYRFTYHSTLDKRLLFFPINTAGFLYYWTHSDLPATAGQIRFRLTPKNDPSLFKQGSDLLRPDGTPWTIPLTRLLKVSRSNIQVLLDDGLVSEDLIRSDYFRLHEKHRLLTCSVLIESPDDVFPMTLPHSSLTFYIATPGEVGRVMLGLEDQPWVEDLKLASPGKRVYVHARLRISDSLTRPSIQIVRIFSPTGAEVASNLPLIQSTRWVRNDSLYQSWCRQTTKES